jgi:hypothetical protein
LIYLKQQSLTLTVIRTKRSFELDSDPSADVDTKVVEVKLDLTPEASKRVSGLTYDKVVVAINL